MTTTVTAATGAKARAGSAWEAMRTRPLRIAFSPWPLRAFAYLASGVVVGVFTLAWLPLAFLAGVAVLTPLAIQPLAALERRRITLLGGPALPDPHRPPDRPGLVAWLRLRHSEAATWRELAYAVLHGTVLLAFDLVATLLALSPVLVLILVLKTDDPPPSGTPAELSDVAAPALLLGFAMIVAVFAICYAVVLAAIAHAALAHLLLAPGEESRIRTLTRSRARLIDAFEVERRRIERDLHDGAQQRLLSLAMTLGMARLEVRDNPEAAQALVDQAAEQAKAALAELRELVRGIHPQILTERGLPAALTELADSAAIPLTLAIDVPRRLPSTVESAAYFVVAEALTNAVKHAQARQIRVTGRLDGTTLVVEVRDDGVGGADPGSGTGLTGLADRVDALSGTLTLSSPPGGPTVLRLELPCSG
ncbi:sensor domain-containing protein [Actinoplanes sp. NEAU-A12]|uniref:histidine kinase n=1 Tax=Actinoplanes sandaracinus TaxID=3045177 RepID=A0ABT6WZP1_9ACTN|nr:sensor histidine kinase [Actinoplanes sandaracinus]MDI6105139.1 sensor domain-containing protein [Actinoplanes sandaracinus]